MTSGLDAIQYGNSYSEWYAIISTGPHIVDLSALLLLYGHFSHQTFIRTQTLYCFLLHVSVSIFYYQ